MKSTVYYNTLIEELVLHIPSANTIVSEDWHGWVSRLEIKRVVASGVLIRIGYL